MNNKIEDVENVENVENAYEYVQETLCGYERRS
jgi:hypothetical protein